MGELRWVEGPVGCTDLVAATGTIVGYVMPLRTEFRGYAIRPGRKKGQRHAALAVQATHPTSEAARAWVEVEATRAAPASGAAGTKGGERVE